MLLCLLSFKTNKMMMMIVYVKECFAKSLVVFGRNAEELTLKLFYWFKHSAARRSDFEEIQFHPDLDDIF
jgi:hypothetical protein